MKHTLGLLCTGLFVTVTLAAPAGADSGQDDTFFAALDRSSIGYESRADAVSAAQSECAALDRGVTFGQLETVLINFSGGRATTVWSTRTADNFMSAAIGAYCPQYAGLVPR